MNSFLYIGNTIFQSIFIWIDCNKLLFLIQTNYSKSVGPLQAAQSRTKSVFKAYFKMM